MSYILGLFSVFAEYPKIVFGQLVLFCLPIFLLDNDNFKKFIKHLVLRFVRDKHLVQFNNFLSGTRSRPLLVLSCYWSLVVVVPILIAWMLFDQVASFVMIFLVFGPQLLCFIPYLYFIPKKQWNQELFFWLGLVAPCILIDL